MTGGSTRFQLLRAALRVPDRLQMRTRRTQASRHEIVIAGAQGSRVARTCRTWSGRAVRTFPANGGAFDARKREVAQMEQGKKLKIVRTCSVHVLGVCCSPLQSQDVENIRCCSAFALADSLRETSPNERGKSHSDWIEYALFIPDAADPRRWKQCSTRDGNADCQRVNALSSSARGAILHR